MSTPSTIVVGKEGRSEQLYIGIIVPLGVIALLVSIFAFFRYHSSKKEVSVREPLCERHCSYLGDPVVVGQPQNFALDPQGYGPSGVAHELSTRPNTMYYPRGQGNHRYSYVVAPAQQQQQQQQEPRADTDMAT
ncbi:hypothetical protein BS50DRAFT_586736 [Corynespora cassiicola Philippines]|uniref:Uncharacterized protein n=1 Tax=Corynespora cassiicola Philippines TaxID=1448308 RepID=A0A2T2NVP0_CORCC|nr:hypothetical protein BS50DRAFT_586736 [Corynespora cassiicola Philippines]